MTSNYRIRKQKNSIGYFYILQRKNIIGFWLDVSDMYSSEESARKEFQRLTHPTTKVEYIYL